MFGTKLKQAAQDRSQDKGQEFATNFALMMALQPAFGQDNTPAPQLNSI